MNRDRRFGGRWSRAQRIKNDALYAALLGLDALARRLPRRWLEALLGRLAHAIVTSSSVARANVAAVFPGWSAAQQQALLARHAERLAQHASAALGIAWQKSAPAALPFTPGSQAVLDAALAEGRGVLLASAHLGAWERVARTLVESGLPLTAVTREPYDARLDRWLGALRRQVPTIARGASGAARAMLRCLRRGEILAVPMDLATRGADTLETTFLGRPTAIVTGPARLALHSGAAVVVATYTRRSGREALAIRRVETPHGEPEAAARLTNRLATALSDAILECPEEWLWLHPRWTPHMSTPLYSVHERWESTRV